MDKNENVRLYKKQLKQIQSVVDSICTERSMLREKLGSVTCYLISKSIEKQIHNLDEQQNGIEKMLNAFGYRISLGWIVEL